MDIVCQSLDDTFNVMIALSFKDYIFTSLQITRLAVFMDKPFLQRVRAVKYTPPADSAFLRRFFIRHQPPRGKAEVVKQSHSK